jgi:hypothetical protein
MMFVRGSRERDYTKALQERQAKQDFPEVKNLREVKHYSAR